MKYNKYYEMLVSCTFDNLMTEDYEFFAAHNMYDYVLYFQYKSDSDRYNDHKNYLLIQKIRFKRIIKDLIEVTNALSEVGIDYRLLKGIGIAECYPESSIRAQGDHDILVKKKDFECARKIIEGLCYEKVDETYHDVSLRKQGSLTIELHYALLHEDREPYTVELEKTVWDGVKLLQIPEGTLLLPEPEWHLRYIVLHMMKHFKGTGSGIRHLIDIINFSNKNDIILVSQISFFEKVGYRKFYEGLLLIIEQSLKYKTFFDYTSYQPDCVEWLSNYILESGLFGGWTKDQRQLVKYEHYSGLASVGSKSWRDLFFPSKEIIIKTYSFADKNLVNLWMAYVLRLVQRALRSESTLSEKLFFFSTKKSEVYKKDEMMKRLGLR